jgi:hypothetical protein
MIWPDLAPRPPRWWARVAHREEGCSLVERESEGSDSEPTYTDERRRMSVAIIADYVPSCGPYWTGPFR